MTQTVMTSAQFRKAAEAKMTEKDWQAQVVRFAKARGWKVYFTWRSTHSPAGYPDLTMVRSTGTDRRIVFVENKTMSGKITDSQHEWLTALREVAAETGGHVEVHLWRPCDWARVEEVLT